MKTLIVLATSLFASSVLLESCNTEEKIEAVVAASPKTFCNPLNLDYRFMVIDGGEGIREAADPVVVSYKGNYLLFASKSSGYWYSKDFREWTHVVIPDSVLPIEDYAPAILVHDDYVYYVGSTRGKGMLYRSNKPEAGEWEKVKEIDSNWDPALFLEGDSLYVYHGSSPSDPIRANIIDWKTLDVKRGAIDCLDSDIAHHGWERPGALNELNRRPYIEGAWMTVHNGKYYLQYAGPGTEWDTYADGVYVGDSPAGPFRYAENNPVSYKPSGFIGGAGHGCLFATADGQWWKAATNSISVRHMFERRLSFYPSGFDADGYLYTDTYLGDYPMFLPGSTEAKEKKSPEWMLLSYHKPVMASSALEEYPVSNITDEQVRTAWVAQSNKPDEWVQIDMQDRQSVYAIQVNYDEYGVVQKGMNGRLHQSYVLEASNDGKQWYVIADRSQKKTDLPHDYIEFEKPFKARYIRWKNKEYNLSANVSLREIRVFGKGSGTVPAEPASLLVERNADDGCKAVVSWKGADNADGYVIRYGIAKDKQYSSIQVMGKTKYELTGLNAGQTYYVSVDAYNAAGLTKGTEVKTLN